MAGFGTMKVEGAAEVERLLNKLPEAAAKRVVRASLSAGARVVRKAAKATLQANSYDTGLLSRTLTISQKRGDPRGSATVTLRASGQLQMVVRKGQSKATPARPSKYAHFVEYGTQHMPAEPFLRPAVDQNAQVAIRAMIDAAGRGLVRESVKLGGKAKLG